MWGIIGLILLGIGIIVLVSVRKTGEVKPSTIASVRIQYESYSDITLREVNVDSIYVENGRPYICGFCHLTGQARVFRADLIEELTDLRTGKKYDYPPSFLMELLDKTVPEWRNTKLPIVWRMDRDGILVSDDWVVVEFNFTDFERPEIVEISI